MTPHLLDALILAVVWGVPRLDRWMHARYLRSTRGGYRR